MATREIKTTIALDGEQKFKQALSAATREMRVMESELKAVSAAYDTNGNSAEYFAAKQANLRDQISQQRQIIQALERAVEDAAQAYGEGSSQVDGYAIRLNNARTRMSRLEKQLEETDREVEELGRDSIRAGRQLEDGIGEGAENAERSVRDLVNTMQEDISSIRTSTAFTAVSGLWDMASGAYNAVSGFVEGTADYRRQLSFLEFNAEENGFGMDGVIDKMIEAQAVTADASAAIEGLSNLLQIEGLSERQFTSAFQNMMGASVRWPETMRFENLAESLQETLATGEAVGAYAELLDRLGVNIEEVNEALKESPSVEGDIDAALAYMDSKELRESYEKYKANNEDLINELLTIAQFEYQAARLGEKIGKHFSTPIKKEITDLMKWLTDVIQTAEKDGLAAAGAKIAGDAYNAIGDAVPDSIVEDVKMWVGATNEMRKIGQSIRQSWVGMNEDISAGIESGLSADKERQIERITSILAGRFYEGRDDIRVTAADGTELVPIGMRDNWAKADAEAEKAGEKTAKSFSTSYMDFMDSEFPRLPNPLLKAQPGQEIVDRLGVEEEWKEKLDAMATDWGQLFPQQVTIETENAIPAMSAAGETVGTALSTGFEESVEEVEDAAEDAGEGAGSAFDESAARFTTLARMRGVEYGRGFGDGIASQYGYVASSTSRLANAANSAFGGTRTSAAAGSVSGAMGNITAVLNLDGRTFARVTAPYLSTAMAGQ